MGLRMAAYLSRAWLDTARARCRRCAPYWNSDLQVQLIMGLSRAGASCLFLLLVWR